MWLTIVWIVVALVAALVAWLVFDWLPAVIAGVIVALGVLWVLGCIFSPAVPDRRCPRCGKEGLVKIRKGEPLGVRCEHCDYRDEGKYVAYLDEW